MDLLEKVDIKVAANHIRHQLAKLDCDSLLKSFLKQQAAKLKVSFYMADEVFPSAAAGASDQIMPIIVWHAGNIFKQVNNKPATWINFTKSNSKLGYSVIPVFPKSDVMPLIYSAEALHDMAENLPRLPTRELDVTYLYDHFIAERLEHDLALTNARPTQQG